VLTAVDSFLSAYARPHVVPDDLARRYAGFGKPLCYVLETRGVTDERVIRRVCLANGLPDPVASLDGGFAPERATIFLERRAGFFGDRIDRRIPPSMRHLVRLGVQDPSLELEFIPVTVLWGRAPDKERSWIRALFVETWERAGWVRRFLTVLVNGRRSLFVQFGEPMSLRKLVGEEVDADRAVRRVTRALRGMLRSQRAAAIGPDLSHQRTIVNQVLRTSAVRHAMADEMRAKQLTRAQVLETAQSYAREIAANYSHVFVNILARLLTGVWNKLYDGVELHNFHHLQSIIEGNEVVYVPCHRSHVDYLLLSYVIYYKGLAIPHIAAGINLNMPVVGSILRRGGAFFMRRSFRGNSLYTMVFMKYLGLMMARGHSIEYFIEGGRSRTGRLLQPKTGMLSMTVRSFLRDPRRPVVFLPVYFGYERLVEGETYIGELSGKAKEKESLFGMLKTLPTLRQRFGKVHVSFGEPIRLAEILDKHAPEAAARVDAQEERPAWLPAAIDDLAERVMTNINSAAAVAPINLLAVALLTTPKQSMIESDLARLLELYAAMLRSAPYSPDSSVTELDGTSIVRHGEAMGVLERARHPLGDVLRMTEKNSVLMTYFRNNVLHLFAFPSLVACCFLNNRSVRTEDVQRLMWRIYPYVCDELFLRWTEDEVATATVQTLEDLAARGLLEASGGAEWRRPPTGSTEAVQLSQLGNVTVQIIERYYLVVAVLIKAGSGRVSQDSLESQCQLMAQRMSFLYELNSPEFFDKALFKNFIDLLRDRAVLGVSAEGRLTYTDMLVAVADDAQFVLHEQIRNSILQVTHR
jgi:glycerol-3-phosphate O-acyltransferase